MMPATGRPAPSSSITLPPDYNEFNYFQLEMKVNYSLVIYVGLFDCGPLNR